MEITPDRWFVDLDISTSHKLQKKTIEEWISDEFWTRCDDL